MAMRPDSGPPAAGGGPQEDTRLEWGRIFRWGLIVVSYAKATFFLSVFLLLIASLLAIYQPLLVGSLVNQLQSLATTGGGEPAKMAMAADAAPDMADAAPAAPNPDVSGSNPSEPGFLDRAFAAIMPDTLGTLAWLFLIIVAAKALANFLAQWVSSWADSKVTLRLQQGMHDKLLNFGPSYHQKHDLGKTSATVVQFAQGAQQMLCEVYRSWLVQLLTFFFAVLTLYQQLATSDIPGYSIGLLFAALVIVPIFGWWLSNYLRDVSTEMRDAFVDVQSEFMNSGAAPMEVQIMNAHQQRAEAFHKKIARQAKVKVKSAFFQTINRIFSSSTTPLLQALFIIAFVLAMPDEPGQLQRAAGAIVAVYLLIPQALAPVQQIVSFFAGVNMSWPQVKVVVDMLETEPEIREAPDAETLAPGEHGVELDHVTFSYQKGGKKILDEISHVFPAGKRSAIVAHAGKGKSTALGLIMRLRDPQEGVIRVGGKDIRQVTLESLRSQVVRVSQYPLFITDSLRANFQLAKHGATDQEIEEVCRKTGFWDQVLLPKARERMLKNPLDLPFTREGGEGKEWSGGERRMLAISRALLPKPSVVFLDEPTSGVDAQWAHEMAKIIPTAFAGMTLILVDHVPDFVRAVAEHIVCLDNGKFVDEGTPDELLARPSLFKDLYDSFDA